MIIDAFSFYRELTMLEYRLLELSSEVDYFLLVEATRSHSGNIKPLYFAENKARFAPYLDRIVHVVVDDMPDGSSYQREYFQRNAIMRGLLALQVKDDDIVLISDVDEIFDPEALRMLQSLPVIQCFRQDMYCYNWHHKVYQNWRYPKAVTVRQLASTHPQHVRTSENLTVIQKGGWHLSCFFDDIEMLKSKMQNYGHQGQNKPEFYNDDELLTKMRHGVHFSSATPQEPAPLLRPFSDYLPPHYSWWMENNRLIEV